MTRLDFDRSVAVVIGIDQYGNGIAPLSTPVSDAIALTQLLKEEHGYDEVHALLDEQATREQLQELISQTLPTLLTEKSRLLFYFAGHGIAQDNDDGQGPAGYLIPQDAQANVVASYLPMKLLHDELTELPCKHFLAIFDCCFAGAFSWSKTRRITRQAEVIHQERFDRFQQDPAWQVITSASYDQEAWDVINLKDDRGETSQQNSPFAAALLNALRGSADMSPPAQDGKPAGDGVITAGELAAYLRDTVEPLTAAGGRKRQTPQICSLRKHDKGEYIFLNPNHELNLPPAPPLNAENNPYRGLEAFELKDEDLFFGRDEEIKQLLAKVADPNPLTVVLGVSGTGKSSLVKAGLLPRLLENPDYQVLPVMRPGDRPFEALARSCAELAPKGDDLHSLSQSFATDKHALANLVGGWKRSNPDRKLLLVIDQTEELVTQTRSLTEKSHFQRLVEQAMTIHRDNLRVVATLRLDFEAQFQGEELRGSWMHARFVVPPMTSAQLREVIEKPAAERVLYFEPSSLVDRLVEDVAQTPGALPLLSFTLSELFLKYLERQSHNRALTEGDYDALGGVIGSLKERANKEYGNLVMQDLAYEHTVKHVMLRMVAVDGGELARRRVPVSELNYTSELENQRVQGLLKKLLRARLIVQGQDGENEAYVEPAHDALVRSWDKLLRWKNQEQVNVFLQRELTPQARNWQEENLKRNSQRARGFLWNNNPRLSLLKEVLESEKSWLNDLETKFVKKSLSRKNRQRQQIVSIVLTALSIFCGIGYYAFSENRQRKISENEAKVNAEKVILSNKKAALNAEEARLNVREKKLVEQELEQQKDITKIEKRIAQEKTIHALLDSSKKSLVSGKTIDSLIEGLKAWEKVKKQDPQNVEMVRRTKAILIDNIYFSNSSRSENKQIAEESKYRFREKTSLDEHDDSVWGISFSPDGEMIASSDSKGVVKLWNRRGKLLKSIKEHSESIWDVVFSPDGESFISADLGGNINIWNLASNSFEELTYEEGPAHLEAVRSVAFGKIGDQEVIATAGDDKTVKLWDGKGKFIRILRSHQDKIRRVTFNPASQQIVMASDNEIFFLDREGEKEKVLSHHTSLILSLAFSPDGKTLASASQDGRIMMWKTEDSKPFKILEGHPGGAHSITWSSDGSMIASAGADSNIILWSRKGDKIQQLRGHSDIIWSLKFSPTHNEIVSGSFDEKVKIWSLETNSIKSLEQHQGAVKTVVFSPDGNMLASGSEDNKIILWNRNGELINEFPAHGKVLSLSFSSDSETIASAGSDNKIILWDKVGNKKQIFDQHKSWVLDVEFNPKHSIIASASADKTIKLWDLRGNLIKTLEKHQKKVWSVAFNSDGDMFASGGADRKVILWNREGKYLWSHEEHTNEVRDVTFSPNGKIVASTGDDRKIVFWKMEGGEARPPLSTNHKDTIMSISFSRDGENIASASADGTIKIWDIQGNQGNELINTLNRHSDIVQSTAFSSDGKVLASASDDGTVKLWNQDPETLSQWSCRWLEDYLQHNLNGKSVSQEICKKEIQL